MTDPQPGRALGTWNDVPDCPGWFYGLSLMHGGGIATVEVIEKRGARKLTFERIDYLRRHAVAQAAIRALETP